MIRRAPVIRSVSTALLLTCSLAASASAQLRPMVYAETTVEVSPSEAFADWTSSNSIESFFAPKATIEPKPGGLYELCFAPDAPEGSCGNDDGRILGLEDGQMVSFTWAMPPYMPEIRPHLTSVQIYFEPIDDETTRVRLFHTGFGTSEAWDQGHDYFEQTWPAVLQNYKKFKEGETP
ncbi:MAG: SRPBCC domain-containing protein [Pseudomonadota bacterium]